MLLLHQVGSVKIGEVVRYTVTYTPSHDRILPSPPFLSLRIRNTCATALRAAFVHGPYTLSVAAYPANFDPNEKFANPRLYGVPEFEPMLKAGGSWNCHLVVPETIRQSAGTGTHGFFGNGPEHEDESVAWIIEVASQVIFSTSAAVHYEILLGRDEKSLNLSTPVPVIGNQAQVPQPGKVSDYQQTLAAKDHATPSKGVFSRAIRLKVEDTASLWNTPQLPGWDGPSWLTGAHHHPHHHGAAGAGAGQPITSEAKLEEKVKSPKKPKKVHLVVLTHGLHSNLGADMLFLKERIDAGVRRAKKDAKARRAKERGAGRKGGAAEDKTQPGDGSEGNEAGKEDSNGDDDGDDEEVIVRGFSGNAPRTERGIKYLGKRMARFVLIMTYPDQPFLPVGKDTVEAVPYAFPGSSAKPCPEVKSSHKHSTVCTTPTDGKRLYKITKISFIAHSLGGLVQTYAVAYIQKHSPQFFDLIEPVNFIAMASPFLGLNHENPLYVKFALDFGLVGRTGQDLGLTWRAPTIARSGWGAIVSNLGENAHKRVYGETQPESKPLLRILPTGPAHTALKKFRNRTVYSNVVNDGIVPLRTSCLLFLDWQGLGRVEKARREAGLVETVVRSGWAELTGANVTSPRQGPWSPVGDEENTSESGVSTSRQEGSHQVPQPPTNATLEDDRQSLRSISVTSSYLESGQPASRGAGYPSNASTSNNPFTGFLNFFRSSDPPRVKSPTPPELSPQPTTSSKQNKIYRRSQTLKLPEPSATNSASSSQSKVTAGDEFMGDSEGISAPPRTTFFESASDLMNPKLPSVEYLIDPSTRPRTIFHDRIYHPSDIPPPPFKRRPTGHLTLRRRSQARISTTTSSASASTPQTDSSSPFSSPSLLVREESSMSKRDYDDSAHYHPGKSSDEVIDSSQLRVEEKIARAYHRDLSWRKVLVKLEPDAHNNLIVRRMFANAFGWPVIHHLVEAHFSNSASARTRDEDEIGAERAKNPAEPPDEHGTETTAETEGKENGVATGLGIEVEEGDGEGGGGHPPKETSEQPLPSVEEHTPTPNLALQRVNTIERTESEDREALDQVPELSMLPSPSSSPPGPWGSTADAGYGPTRPCYDRLDSVSWSDRDWADSADESEVEHPGKDKSKGNQLSATTTTTTTTTMKQGDDATASPDTATDSGRPLSGSWNWAEKIVGKGASRTKSALSESPRPK